MNRSFEFRQWIPSVKKFYFFGFGMAFYAPLEENPVSQFIGIKDKNEKKIFEGDIIKIKSKIGGKDKESIEIVCYSEALARFFPTDMYDAELEIVGNTFEAVVII